MLPDDVELSYCEQVLFGVGDLQVSIEIGTGRVLGQSYAQRATLTKKNGAEVCAHIYANPSFSGISAVLYTADHFAMLNPPRLRSRLVHNPEASTPLEREIFRFGIERWVDSNGVLMTRDWRVAPSAGDREDQDI